MAGASTRNSELRTAYGTVDEAQAILGLARAEADAELEALLIPIMTDLYVLMAELATLPDNRTKLTPGTTAVSQEMVDRLEHTIDDLDTRFEPPTEFVVPGGNVRGVARPRPHRGAARRAASLPGAAPPSLVVPYLNRLSDLLWTMARWQEGTSTRATSAGGADCTAMTATTTLTDTVATSTDSSPRRSDDSHR